MIHTKGESRVSVEDADRLTSVLHYQMVPNITVVAEKTRHRFSIASNRWFDHAISLGNQKDSGLSFPFGMSLLLFSVPV